MIDNHVVGQAHKRSGKPKSKRMLARLMGAKSGPFVDADLAWFLQSSDAAMGERSVMATLMAIIEFGIPQGCTDPETRYTDAHLGWGKVKGGQPRMVGDVERARYCAAAWQLMSKPQRDVLSAKYCLVQGKLPPGIHGAFGEFSGVVMLLGLRREKIEEVLSVSDERQPKSNRERLKKTWRARAEKADLEAHATWLLARAESESL